MCYQLEKLIKEHASKLKDSDKEPLKRAIEKTREKAKGNDVQAIKSAIEELEQASHAFSKVIYEKAGAGAQAKPSGSAEEGSDSAAKGKGNDDAIDAEFEVKDS